MTFMAPLTVGVGGSFNTPSPQRPQFASDFGRPEFVYLNSIVVDGESQAVGVSTMLFDGQEEFLWIGTQMGRVSRYQGMNMQPYGSFQVVTPIVVGEEGNAEIRSLFSVGQSIFSLTANSLSCNLKNGGIPMYQYRSPSLMNMQCAAHSPRSPNIYCLGGHQPLLVQFDVQQQHELRQIDIGEGGCVINRFSDSYLCCGDIGGNVTFVDPNSLSIQHRFQFHNGCLSDFDVSGHQLISCGFSNQRNELVVDRHLVQFDLRYMKATMPVHIAIDPMFVRFATAYANHRICVVGQTGQFQMVDPNVIVNALPAYQVPCQGPITAFDLSPSNLVLAFGDSCSHAHQFGSCLDNNSAVNRYTAGAQAPPNAMFPANHAQQIMTQSAGGEHYNHHPQQQYQQQYENQGGPGAGGFYNSTAPNHYAPRAQHPGGYQQHQQYRPHQQQQQYGGHPQHQQYGGRGGMGGGGRGGSMGAPPRGGGGRGGGGTRGRNTKSFEANHSAGSEDVMADYRRVEVKRSDGTPDLSSTAVEEFDFRIYNRTQFVGLEPILPNSYCNSMLQVLYFTEPLRCELLGHRCGRESCVACELSFLFDLMDQQRGLNALASNFLRTFCLTEDAIRAGLVLADTKDSLAGSNLRKLIQDWTAILLARIDKELSLSAATKGSDEEDKGSPGIVRRLFGRKCRLSNRCETCGTETNCVSDDIVNDVTYPYTSDQEGGDGVVVAAADKVDFTTVLDKNLNEQRKTRKMCSTCNKEQLFVETRQWIALPDILCLNCHLESAPNNFITAQQEIIRHEAMNQSLKKLSTDDQLSTATGTQQSSRPPCRFGDMCHNQECTFMHNNVERNIATVSVDSSRDSDAVRGWIPTTLKVTITADKLVQSENIEGTVITPRAPQTSDDANTSVFYELTACVAHITDKSLACGNLVSIILGGEKYHQRKEKCTTTQWYLMNDFCVKPIEKQETIGFHSWKVPCILQYTKREVLKQPSITPANPLTSDVLLVGVSRPMAEVGSFEAGQLIGFDIEFSQSGAAGAEVIKTGGTAGEKITSADPRLISVARITCVKTDGSSGEKIAFINDHLSERGQQTSDGSTVTFKSSYLKLKYLVNAKVIFVGHDLKRAFRILNLFVPPDQVVDVGELFRLPKQRSVPLKFLAWHFLNGVPSAYDPVENTSVCLRLYNLYTEIVGTGPSAKSELLNALYEKGRSMDWRTPNEQLVAADGQ